MIWSAVTRELSVATLQEPASGGHRPSARGDDGSATVELGLQAGDLPFQLGLGSGQSVGSTRDAPDHRLTRLGALQPRRRARLSLLFGLVLQHLHGAAALAIIIVGMVMSG